MSRIALDPRFEAELRRLQRKLDGIRGRGVVHSRDNVRVTPPTQKPHKVIRPQGIVHVRNNSGFAVDRFDVLGLDEAAYDPLVAAEHELFKFRVLFEGVTPVSGSHEGRFGILKQDLQPGEIGEALVDGVTVCTVNVQDVAQEYCDINDDDRVDLLTAWGGSARILWKEAGTGQRWAIVHLGAGDVGTGQYQGQVLTTVSQNARGWDFPTAYALPPL
jgi:hypothetical protein